MGLGKEHFPWVDITKVISIFGVVYIHSGTAETSSLNTGSYFRFVVPIFIVISFFLSETSLQRQKNYSKKNFLKKRLLRLAIPYVVWSTLYAIGQFYLGIRPTIDFGPTFAWQGQYFFIVLIQLTMLYPWLRLVKINEKILLIFLAVTLTSLYLPCNYFGICVPFIFSGETAFFYWTFYVFLAIYLARNINKISHLSDSIPSYFIPLIILTFPIVIVIENFYINSQFPYLRISVLLTSSILTILFVRLNFHFKPLNSTIRMLSKYSLGIFCMNPIIIISIQKIATYSGLDDIIFSQTPAFISRFIVASITCVLAIPICLFLERMRLGSLVK